VKAAFAADGEEAVAEPYLIKKYSSRRLYDVAAGGFLTIGDVDRLIRQGRRIKVVDAKGKDATRGVLLQILTEREEGGEPLLSVDLLHEMVRLYGNAMQGPFGRFLEEGMAVLRTQREAWQEAMPDAFRQGTSGIFGRLMQQQASWWKAAQDAWLGSGDEQEPPTPPTAKPPPRKRRR
jgi:polyhydroxyalkanoate synthesis repressor PhaR